MGWIYLILAGSFEVVGVTGLNKINQKRNWQSVALMIGGFVLSFFFLSRAMKTISMGTAYAVWTGIGTAGGALVGMCLYGESKDWRRILFISMVLAATVGLKLIS
jgi:paired small multidrug resistance pump